MSVYYNENEPFLAEWLRNLISAGHLPDGVVDERSIVDVRASDLEGFAQAHFFAGVGGWPIALRLAGFAGEVWTGSPPCQPFSEVGRRRCFDDERHLWPAWFDLVRQRRPPILFGENVRETVPLGWFDQISADLESEDYAVGAAVLSACAVEAPHERERLWFVAYANGEQAVRPSVARLERHSWPAEPAVARVAHGVPRQRDIVCAYGNALVPALAAEFIHGAVEAIRAL